MQTYPTTLRLSCLCLALAAAGACHKSTTSAAPSGGGGTTDGNTTAPPSVTIAQADIGTAGGALTSPAHDATLTVPARALAGNATLTVALVDPTQVASAGLTLASEVFEFGPSGTQFGTPATLALHVSTTVTSANVVVATLAGNGKWQPLAGSSFDAATGVVTAPISHFSIFAAVVVPNAGRSCAAFSDPNGFCAPGVCDSLADACVSTQRVGGTISGLVLDTQIVVHNGQTSRTASYPDTGFQFATAYPDGTAYNITVDGNSPGLSCTVAHPSGVLGDPNAMLPAITCTLNLAFGSDPNAHWIIGQNDAVSDSNAFDDHHINKPYAVFAGTNGYLYVSDSNNFRALVYASLPDRSGEAANYVLGQPDFNSRNDWTTQLSPGADQMQPCGIAGDDDNLLVTDCDMHRALLFTPLPDQNDPNAVVALGQPDLSTQGSNCGAAGLFGPMGAAVVDGKVIIADSGNHRVLIWDTIPTDNGIPADRVLGRSDFVNCAMPGATTAASLYEPSGVWTDGTRLLVADSFNNRVLAWNTFPTTNGQPADGVIGQTDFTTATGGSPGTHTGLPFSVAVNGNQVYVSEYTSNRITVWNGFPTAANVSTLAGAIGQPDLQSSACNRGQTDTPAADSLCNPTGLQIIGNQLVVADYGNNRIVSYLTY